LVKEIQFIFIKKEKNMKKDKLIPSFLTVLSLIFLLSCNKDSESGTVSISFDHKVGAEVLELENKAYQSAAGHPFYVYRLKYYISEIALHKMDGTSIQFETIHYRDITDQNTRTLNIGEIPEGNYNRLTFIFGLDEKVNIDGGLPNTQTNVNMEWPIPGDQGYHYMKFEGKYDVNGTGELKNFNLHTGATSGNQNYVEVSLPITTMNVDGNDLSIMMEMDLMEWLQNPNTYDFDEFGPMIMMNQNAQLKLKENGQTVFSIADVVSN
jgi:hypothetical protein